MNCKHCSPLNRIGQTGPGGGGRGEEVMGEAGRQAHGDASKAVLVKK